MTTSTAAHAAPTVATTPQKRTTVTELGADWAPVFDELSEVSLARAEAERREKELKAMIAVAVGQPADRKHTIAVRVGTAIRAKISMRGRTNINGADLMAGFPEAYEACRSETEYVVVSPA